MCVGEKRKLKIPAKLGYGAQGSPPTIPGNIFVTSSCCGLNLLPVIEFNMLLSSVSASFYSFKTYMFSQVE